MQLISKLKSFFSKPNYNFEIVNAIVCKHNRYEIYCVKYSAVCKNTGTYVNRIIYNEDSITSEQLKTILDTGNFIGNKSYYG